MEKVGNNVFVETVYPGVNVGCIVTDGGSICIDTPLLSGEAQRWRGLVRSLGGEPVRFVVYTDGRQERILGTQYLIETDEQAEALQARAKRDGKNAVSYLLRARESAPLSYSTPAAGERARAEIRRQGPTGGSAVIAHKLAWPEIEDHRSDSFKQSMVDLLADRDPDIVDLDVVAPQIMLDTNLKLYVGDEVVKLIAAAPGMLWAWLPKRGVLFTGDIVVVGSHPPLDVTDTRAWLGALTRIRRTGRFRNAVIVPGRGPLCDATATRPLTKYLRIARDRTRRIVRAGRSKTHLNRVAEALLPLYPVADGQHERVQRQIKMALDDLYDEFKAAEAKKG